MTRQDERYAPINPAPKTVTFRIGEAFAVPWPEGAGVLVPEAVADEALALGAEAAEAVEPEPERWRAVAARRRSALEV